MLEIERLRNEVKDLRSRLRLAESDGHGEMQAGDFCFPSLEGDGHGELQAGDFLTPQSSHLTPHTSHLTPHTSHLTPHTLHLTPHTSHLSSFTPTVVLGSTRDPRERLRLQTASCIEYFVCRM